MRELSRELIRLCAVILFISIICQANIFFHNKLTQKNKKTVLPSLIVQNNSKLKLEALPELNNFEPIKNGGLKK